MHLCIHGCVGLKKSCGQAHCCLEAGENNYTIDQPDPGLKSMVYKWHTIQILYCTIYTMHLHRRLPNMCTPCLLHNAAQMLSVILNISIRAAAMSPQQMSEGNPEETTSNFKL